MRAVLLVLLSALGSCSLVVDKRIAEYEGACADEEEAARSRYDDDGAPSAARNARPPLQIALQCDPCSSEDCVEDCIVSSTTDLSLECSACFADAALCVSGCRDSCQGGPLREAECLICVCRQGCAEPLNTCAGIVLADCTGVLD